MDRWINEGGVIPPFGVIELDIQHRANAGQFLLIKKKSSFEKELVYRCHDEVLYENYHFYVFNHGATFEMLDRVDGNIVVPISPFSQLLDDTDDIIEAKTCSLDANFQATHPEGFLFSKPLPDTAIENVPEEIRYAMDDLEDAKMATSQKRVMQAVTMAEGYCERIRNDGMTRLPRVVRENYGTLYQERRASFLRPSLKESLEPLPSSLEVSRGPPPNVLVKPEDLIKAYNDKVCNLLNFPYLFFAAHTSTINQSTKNASGSHLDFSQKQLEDSVIQQQALFEHLYRELYMRSFIHLDMPIFSQMASDEIPVLQHLRIRIIYNNLISKSDSAIHGLLPFYTAGIVSKDDIKRLLERNFGIIAEDSENCTNK
jgi:hypothetical protein